MGMIASQITTLTIVYSTVYSDADQRKYHRDSGLCVGNSPETGEFPAQIANNAENVSIWWRHHDFYQRVDEKAARVRGATAIAILQWHIRNGGLGSPCLVSSLSSTDKSALIFQENHK